MNIEITSFTPYRKKTTIQGFLAVRLTEPGLEIRDIALHQKDGKRWLQLPAKPYTKPDGRQGWSYILNFYEKEHFNKFQEVVLKALDAFQHKNRRNAHDPTAQMPPKRIASPNSSKMFKLSQAILSLSAEYKQTENNINELSDRIPELFPGVTPKEVCQWNLKI